MRIRVCARAASYASALACEYRKEKKKVIYDWFSLIALLSLRARVHTHICRRAAADERLFLAHASSRAHA